MKDALRRFGGIAGILIALSGAGVRFFAPDFRGYGLTLMLIGAALTVAGLVASSDDLRNLVKGRPFRHGANAVFYSLVVLAITGAVNFLGARHSTRIDLTEQKLHSLSPQTVKILEGLTQDVTVTAFYSSTVASRQQAIDLLDEFRHRSPRIEVRMIDPDRSPGEARAYGIEQYGTVIVSCGTGEARITPATLGEEDLTNALIKATSSRKKVICFLGGHGERSVESGDPDGYQQAGEALRKENFEVKEVRLLEAGDPLAECSSLVIAAARNALLDPEIDSVKAFLAEGGRALVLDEPHAKAGLDGLLSEYGLIAGEDFIVDVNPMSRLFGGSPAAPVVYEYGSHDITKDFEGIATIFPTVRSVSAASGTIPGVQTAALAHTSDQSWGEVGALADRVSFDEGMDRPGPLDVAAASWVKPPAEPAADPNHEAADQEAEGRDAAASRPETRLVLFGDADFAANSAFMAAGNKDLFLNTVAWLNESSDLISIRPRSRTAQPVILTGLQARALLVYSLLLSPLAIVVIGVGVYLRRRRL